MKTKRKPKKPAVKVEKPLLCAEQHMPINFDGAHCPVCAQRAIIHQLEAENAKLWLMSSMLGNGLKSIGDQLATGLYQHGVKISALDEAIATLISGPEQRCGAQSNLGDITGHCIRADGHDGEHVYSLRTPA
jgi:hypothetical protein